MTAVSAPLPQATPATDLARRAFMFGRAFAIAAMAIAAANLLLGWGLGLQAFVRIHPAYPAMVPETALAILLGATGALLLHSHSDRRFPRLCGALILLLVVAGEVAPVRSDGFRLLDAMSLATAIACSALALRLILHGTVPVIVNVLLDSAGLCVVAIATLGYVFDAEALFANRIYISMALHTALSLLAIFVSLALSAPAQGWMGVLLAPERGSQVLRNLLPVIVLGPVLLAGLGLYATGQELLAANFRLAILCFGIIVSVGGAALWFSHLANQSQREARAAQASLRRSEEARMITEIAMAHAQKTDALGRLVGGVAHDFNNALAVVLGNLELMQEEDDPKQLAASVVDATAAANQAAQLTRQLLAYGRRSRLEVAPHRIDTVTEEALRLFRRVCPPSIEIEPDLSAGRAVALLDSGNFQQAVLNILINARDALPDGGTIYVTTEVEFLEGESVAGFAGTDRLAGGDYVSVTIRDTGTGMSADTLSRADEPFFTTKPVGKGTGLGLSVVAGFCRQSGGGLKLRSKLGSGTTVTMIFPLADLDNRTAPDSVGQPEARTGPLATILVVDDDPAVTRVMSRQLLREGYAVSVASDGIQALELMARGPLPDLVLTDLGMPGRLQGRDLAVAIREQYPDIRIILMSGYDSDPRRSPGDSASDLPFLPKPVDRASLSRTVHQTLSSLHGTRDEVD